MTRDLARNQYFPQMRHWYFFRFMRDDHMASMMGQFRQTCANRDDFRPVMARIKLNSFSTAVHGCHPHDLFRVDIGETRRDRWSQARREWQTRNDQQCSRW